MQSYRGSLPSYSCLSVSAEQSGISSVVGSLRRRNTTAKYRQRQVIGVVPKTTQCYLTTHPVVSLPVRFAPTWYCTSVVVIVADLVKMSTVILAIREHQHVAKYPTSTGSASPHLGSIGSWQGDRAPATREGGKKKKDLSRGVSGPGGVQLWLLGTKCVRLAYDMACCIALLHTATCFPLLMFAFFLPPFFCLGAPAFDLLLLDAPSLSLAHSSRRTLGGQAGWVDGVGRRAPGINARAEPRKGRRGRPHFAMANIDHWPAPVSTI
ncbi:hypothetical protein J3F83DRAFT_14347 [Trichoderma novae-zelandiae]